MIINLSHKVFFSLIILSFASVSAFADKKTDEADQSEKISTTDAVDKDEIIDIKDRGGDFSLIAKSGWVSLSDFKGKVVAIYFGYTKCPDVCPTNLSFLSSAIAAC